MACATVAVVLLWSPVVGVGTSDRNGDGQPDTWRAYDHQGRLSEVAIDTNFDGRADVREYYKRGALMRRESDRDFNNHIDLVQEFDPATRQPMRSVTDFDFDGRADLLVVFQDGQPVFSKWARQVDQAAATGVSVPKAESSQHTENDQLTPLEDPFGMDVSVRAVHALVRDSAGLSTSGGLPAPSRDAASLSASPSVIPSLVSRPLTANIVPRSPRGPPAAHLLG